MPCLFISCLDLYFTYLYLTTPSYLAYLSLFRDKIDRKKNIVCCSKSVFFTCFVAVSSADSVMNVSVHKQFFR